MKTMINIKTDTALKNKAQKLAADLGLPLGTVVNNYLRTFVVERHVVFEKPLVPNKATRKILDKALADIKSGNMKNFSPAFTNTKDMRQWLEKNVA